MKVVISWRNPPAWVVSLAEPGVRSYSESPEERRESFEKRLSRVDFYQKRELRDRTTLHEFLEQKHRFAEKNGKALRPGFRTPVESEAITVVGAPLEGRRGVTVLEAKQWQRLHLSRTTLLAAPPPILRQVVACVECSLMALPRLSDAIVVLNSVEHGMLLPGEREMLWRVFGLPIYEQWLGFEGELLAWECGAHQGLHINEAAMHLEREHGQLLVTSYLARKWMTRRLETGWTAELETRACLCGENSPRLRYLRKWHADEMEELRASAAYA